MAQPGYGNLIYKRKNRKVPRYLLVLTLTLLALAAVILFKEPQPGKETEEIEADRKRMLTGSLPDTRPDNTGPNSKRPHKPLTESSGHFSTSKNPAPGLVEPDQKQESLLNQASEKLREDRLVFRGMNYYNGQQFYRAIPIFKEIIQTNKAYFVHLGVCYFKVEDYPNAQVALEKALEFDNNSFLALKYITLATYKLGKLRLSERYCRRALNIMQDDQLKFIKDRIQRETSVMKHYGTSSKVHFEIRFSRYDHNAAGSMVLEVLEEARREIGKKMNHFVQEKTKVILYNEKSFFDVTRAPGWAGGLYDGIIRLPIQGMTRISKDLKRIIFHEYTHAYVHALTRVCPLWLNEGLAEYFSIGEHVRTIGQVIPLTQLERSFPAGNLEMVAIAYRESYSAVKYLAERYRMFKILELLKMLSTERDFSMVFRKVFLISYQQFLNTWGVRR